MSKHRILIVTTIIILLMFILYIARGWIRGSVIPATVNFIYKNAIDEKFDKVTPVIQEELTNLGFSFVNNVTTDPCNDIHYSGLQVSIECSKSIKSFTTTATDNFAENWSSKSKEFENQLLSDGWQDGWEDHLSISELYSSSVSEYVTANKFYTKYSDGIECTVFINYEVTEKATYASIKCVRYFHYL